MSDQDRAELERRVGRDLEDAAALVELARLAQRTGVVPDLFGRGTVREALARAWLDQPRVRALWEFVLPAVGLEVLRGKPFPPGSWWQANGRLGEEDDLHFDLVSDMPLAFRRVADGAVMLLVPSFSERFGPFLMDRYPITQDRWRRMIGSRHRSWPSPSFFASLFGGGEPSGEHPVHRMEKGDVGRYLRAVDAALPTRDEWAAAAVGTDGRRYPWGDEYPDPARANLGAPDGRSMPVTSTPRGTSPFGIEDMLGNVSEETADTQDSDSLMSEKSWTTVCGAGFRGDPETETALSTNLWRYTRNPPPLDMGFRPVVRLEEIPARLRYRD